MTCAAGDEHDPNGKVEFKHVVAIFKTTAKIWHVQVKGKTIRTTSEHPFYVWGQGWTAAKEMKPGDRLRSDDGRMVTVSEIYETEEVEAVYNCAVEDYHTYFVGAEDWEFTVWAHNACSSTSGENAAASVGRTMHKAYSAVLEKLGYATHVVLKSGRIADGVNFSKRVVRELNLIMPMRLDEA
jgi:hypothetical protein